MRGRLELNVTYAARRPWVPRRAQFVTWANAALFGATQLGAAQLGAAQLGAAQLGAAQLGAAQATAARDATCFVISVRVVGAGRSRSLNARYRHKDRPTNVLSFSGAGMIPDGRNFLGELVICAPVVAHEARTQAKAAAAHWAHMTVHGVLHLLGFDHERTAEARKMAAREIQILDRLGFSNPYA